MSEPKAPRLTLPEDQWTGEMREMFEPTIKTFGRVFNIFTTLGRHPKLLKRWMVFANHCLLKSSLTPRDELVILMPAGSVIPNTNGPSITGLNSLSRRGQRVQWWRHRRLERFRKSPARRRRRSLDKKNLSDTNWEA